MPTFIEISNTFGFTVAVLALFGYAAYRTMRVVVKHLTKESETKDAKYEALFEKTQAESQCREKELKDTLREIEAKAEIRDREYRVIIHKLSENFDVLKEVSIKLDGFETRFGDIETELKKK